jgi:hypothetical protein
MFSEFRTEVHSVLAGALPDIALWDVIPEDVNELPCIVVGRPGGRQTATAVVFDLELTVFVIGRRHTAGRSEAELMALADQVFTVLGGTRGTRTPQGEVVGVTRIDPRELAIAGQNCPAYALEVEASATTC